MIQFIPWKQEINYDINLNNVGTKNYKNYHNQLYKTIKVTKDKYH